MELTGYTCPVCKSDQFEWVEKGEKQEIKCKDCGWQE